jgi:hypothetical protein
MTSTFFQNLNQHHLEIINSFKHPFEIQALLDRTPYSPEDRNRTPAEVLQEGLAHCLDGAIFAAAALRLLGFPPLLVDMFPDPGMDDDHVLAIFKQNNCFGALAKSNFSGLRSREPIYRTIRELVISYFDDFFNVDGIKTLRSYTRPLNLQQFDPLNWFSNTQAVDAIEQRLLKLHRFPVISAEMGARLWPVDSLSYQAGMLGVNPDGLYKPGKKQPNH